MKNYDRRERLWNIWSHVLDMAGLLALGVTAGVIAAIVAHVLTST